ncbi:anti-sigma factor [Paenibacillus sp. R14(2021)]|uniref:anti-sigma factor family protein n=1 Tax=Paenibacillus sp. R14(2021) TaxID=2859228 RepID=UPI001C615AEA|nr:zf-HC2 domain-containing protein [Paenibacillus sp. R14(2021)]
MKHRTAEEWLAYIADELREEERVEAEKHLKSCDACLALYMDVLTVDAPRVERLHVDRAAAITDQVMDTVRSHALNWRVTTSPPNPPPPSGEAVNRRAPAKRSKRKETMIHYLIAVFVMLLLMSTGVFQRLATHPHELEAQLGSKTESVSTSIMTRTTAVIQAFVAKSDKSTNAGKE